MFKAIESRPNGDRIAAEFCVKYYGKETYYTANGEILNHVNDGEWRIAAKSVQAHEAFFTKEGKIQTADRADWKSFTELFDGCEW